MSKSDLTTAPAPQPDRSADDPRVVAETDRLAAAVARAERRQRVLEEIGEIGMRLMRKLEDAARRTAGPSSWSSFHEPSPRPILKQNQNYHRQTYELAKPPP